jgi:hypothetical protein
VSSLFSPLSVSLHSLKARNAIVSAASSSSWPATDHIVVDHISSTVVNALT